MFGSYEMYLTSQGHGQRLWTTQACYQHLQFAESRVNTTADVWERTGSVGRLDQRGNASIGVADAAGVGRGNCAAPKQMTTLLSAGASALDTGHVPEALAD
jgi:hypothetical protein